jgi:hypothetical protein
VHPVWTALALVFILPSCSLFDLIDPPCNFPCTLGLLHPSFPLSAFLPSLFLPSFLPSFCLPSYPLSAFLPTLFLPPFLLSSFFPCFFYHFFIPSLSSTSVFLPSPIRALQLIISHLPAPPSFPPPLFPCLHGF